MKNKIWLSVVASFLPIMANADCDNNSEYCADGTDYSNAVVNTWVEDQSNEFTDMAGSFACILRNTGTALNANKTWEALISENICGLDDEAQPSELSRAVMKSTRTSNTSDQLGEFYFYGNGKRNFVGNLIGKRGPDQFAPFGEWYVSYYLGQYDDGPLMTYDTSFAKGLVDITEPSPGKVAIKTVDIYDTSAFGGSDYNMLSRVEYADSTFAESQILGRRWGTDRWPGGTRVYDEVTAGRTNEDYYFRVKFPTYNNGGAGSATTEAQCFNRNSLVKSTHEYGLYEKATGKKLSLTGGFGFTFNSGSNRGYFDRWGVWLDSGRLLPFNAKTPTLAVVNERTQENVTLSWAPGKLEKLETATEALPKDTTKKTVFRFWTNQGDASLSIAWDGSKFVGSILDSSGSLIADPFGWSALDTPGKILTADINRHKWLGWAYSDEKNTQIYWDGGDAIKFNVTSDASSDSTLLSSQYTKLVAKWGNPPNENLPVDAATYQSVGASNREMYSYIRDTDSEKGQASNLKYYFTGLTPPSGKLARTLYRDLGDEGPTSEDKEVMFNFNIDRSTGEYHPFNATDGYGTKGDWNDTGNDWPYDQLELFDALDNSVRYRWNFEANPWGQSIVAVDSSGDIIELDQPLKFKYTHTTSNDINYDDINEEAVDITFIAISENYNPVRKMRRTDGTAACAEISGNTDFEECTISAADFDEKEFLLDYDGNWLGGLPSVSALFSASDLSGNYWTRLVNPRDETVLKDTASDKEYVIKALGVSSAYQNAPQSIYTSDCNPENDISFPGGVLTDGKYGSTPGKSCTCDGLAFNSVDSFGWDMSSLPEVPVAGDLDPEYPKITQSFSNAATLSSASEYTVTMGDTSGC